MATIVLCPSDAEFSPVASYYAQTKVEPGMGGSLTVSKVVRYKFNLSGLLDEMIAQKATEYVVISHGVSSGLLLSVTPDSDVDIMDPVPETILQVEAADALSKVTPDTLANWTKILQIIKASPTDTNFLNDKTLKDDEKIAQAKTLLKTWQDGRLKDWKTSSSSLNGLVSKLRAVWQLKLTNIEIRGCNVGRDAKTLTNIRNLLRAQRVSAPTCSMFYGPVSPFFPRPTDVAVFTATARNQDGRRIFFPPGPDCAVLGPVPVPATCTSASETPTNDPPGKPASTANAATRAAKSWAVLEVVEKDPSHFSFSGAVNQRQDIEKLANELLPSRAPAGTTQFFIGGMWDTDDCRFPGKSDYIKSLAEVK